VILDSSAIVSVLTEEIGYEDVVRRASAASMLAVGAPTLVQTAMVLSPRLGKDSRRLLNGLLRKMDVEIIPFTEEHYEVAVDAFERFGKGRHPAALNFGDCLTYAVARLSGLPLLYTGNDFARTDLAS
jgi:ribonuclease VapC